MSTTIDDDIHSGHSIEVREHHDGTFEALSSVLNESITDLDKEGEGRQTPERIRLHRRLERCWRPLMPAYCPDCDEETTFLDIVTEAGHRCTNDDCPRDRARYPDRRRD